VNVNFNVRYLIPFVARTNDKAKPINLRTNPFQMGRDDGKLLIKGSSIRVIVKHIQEK